MASPPLCIHQLLLQQAERIPDAPAIVAPEHAPLTYGRLRQHVDDTVQMLRALGVGRNDRVAVVLPNGAEMAVAFLAVAAGATCAPLNPAYSSSEFDFYLSALRANALIVQAGMDSPGHAVARTRGLRLLELTPMPEAASGLFTLRGETCASPEPQGFSQPDDLGLVLHTTGSTAQPKIVPLTQRNICAGAHNIRMALALHESDRCLNVMPLFHGHGLKGVLLPSLLAGASILCAPDFSAPQFFAHLAAFRPTWYSAVPTMHQAIVAQAPWHGESIAASPLRYIRSTSAFLPRHVLDALEKVFKAPVIEAYGTTEASMITCNPLPPRQRKAGSGGIAAGPQVAIMDAAGNLLPAGVRGEVVARGAGVIQRYDNDATVNQESFTRGWFKTGDQGYFDADGYLFITGRIKEIINRGGEKIAPQEVDDVLLQHPAVAQAVSFALPHPRLGEDIAAAVVLQSHAVATEHDLRTFAATRLAAFKVPQQILMVDAIPRGPTGKLQRLGLAEQFGLTAFNRVQPKTPDASPPLRTPLQEVLVGLWTQVLQHDGIDIHDNFYHLGGDSILATQLMSRVREVLRVEVSFLDFFATPTVVAMAKHLEAAQGVTPKVSAPPLRPVPRGKPLPLSYAQQRLWFLEQLGLSSHAYTLLEVIRWRGRLHVEALAQSLRDMTARHEILRTTFVEVQGEPLQMIAPSTSLPLQEIDLQALPASEREAHIRRLARQQAQRPFNLAQGPLLRATLLRLHPEEHVLLLSMHHIVSDGWSHGVFWREVAVLYAAYLGGTPAGLPELPIQYADFAHWQLQWMQGEALEQRLAYWKQHLAGMSTLQLPTDRPRPAVWSSRGARHALALPRSLSTALKTLSQQHGITLFMTLLAAFQTLLHRYSGQDDIAVGSLIANRNRIETEGVIGFFVNTLVLRTDLSGNPRVRELFERVREVTLGTYSYQELPFEKLLEALRPQRELSRNPLFQVLFVLQNTPRHAPELAGLAVSAVDIETETAKFDLMLEISETPEGLRGYFEYGTDIFDAATIARMGSHLQTLLQGLVATPEQRLAALPLLSEAEQRCLLVEWNTTRRDYPDHLCMHHLFEAQAARTPNAVALVSGNTSLTYRELNRRANQVAHTLQLLGIGTETRVGLCMERCLDMVVALLAILKAGGAYLPLDPTYPRERLAFMLANAQVAVLLTQQHLVGMVPGDGVRKVCMDTEWPVITQQRAENPVSHVQPDNAAYVLYTSGSTGKPKGVVGSHRATLNTLAWMWHAYPFAAGEVCAQKTSLSFVDAIQELLGPLLQGVPTVLIADAVVHDPTQLVHLLATHAVTRILLVPSLLYALLETPGDLHRQLPNLTLWLTSGEVLGRDLWQRFHARLPHRRLLNLYGASEDAADVTCYDTALMPHERWHVPIGRPIANTQLYVLDRHLQPVPIGVPGDIYVAGAGLARGYLRRPELTAATFVPHPFSDALGARLYKTGDVARYLPDGNLEFLGRRDRQVKVRGYRIELGEIEAALEQYPDMRHAVVLAHADTPGDTRLIAYLVADPTAIPSPSALYRFLKTTLPDSMLPSAYVLLDALPLTPNGKIDRLALPDRHRTRPALDAGFTSPRTPTEEVLVGIWASLLGIEQVGIHDNFFHLGGHSLLAVQVISRLRHALHVEIAVRALFDAPTVASLAGYIDAVAQAEQRGLAPPIVPMPHGTAKPVTMAQEQLWLFTRLLPNTPFFNIPYALRLHGALNAATLEQSMNEMVKRHEILRTAFVIDDEQLLQAIAPTLRITLEVEDFRALPAGERDAAVQRRVREEAQKPFDLTQAPLLRMGIWRVDEQDYVLLLTIHHIIGDGWSMGVLTHELAVLYEAFSRKAPSPLPALPVQYADFAYWQRQWHDSEAMRAQLTYWTQQLRDPLPMLELPADRMRTLASGFRTARQSLQLSPALSEALTHLSRQRGVTLFMTLLAAFDTLLYSYTGQTDFCVATHVANRNRQETEGVLGFFVNTVLLRTDLSGNPTFAEMLWRVRETTLAAYANQDLPFETLVRALEHERPVQRASLCQVMFLLQNARLQPVHLPGLMLQPLEVDESIQTQHLTLTTFDCIMMLSESPRGLVASCIYQTVLFDATTMQRLLDDYRRLLARLVLQPEQPLVRLASRRPSSQTKDDCT